MRKSCQRRNIVEKNIVSMKHYIILYSWISWHDCRHQAFSDLHKAVGALQLCYVLQDTTPSIIKPGHIHTQITQCLQGWRLHSSSSLLYLCNNAR